MGKSDPTLERFYRKLLPKKEPIAILGSQNRFYYDNQEDVDVFDMSFNGEHHWNINSEWILKRQYGSIVCTRCPYFAKDPWDFIKRCHRHLLRDGQLLIDFGLGDHWRFENFKVGWSKDGEHEFSYHADNFLWSTVWDDEFLSNNQFKAFAKWIKRFGYDNVEEAIYDEVPMVMDLSFIKIFFDISTELLALWPDAPQLYVFINGTKR